LNPLRARPTVRETVSRVSGDQEIVVLGGEPVASRATPEAIARPKTD
jgi:hypothetical protein